MTEALLRIDAGEVRAISVQLACDLLKLELTSENASHRSTRKRIILEGHVATKESYRLGFHRRELLAGAAYIVLGISRAKAAVIVDHLPWTPNAGNPPEAALPGPWHFFTADEGRAVEAIADRVIPPDAQTPGGKDSGSAVFIDRQLAGPYGRQDGLYVRPPFRSGVKTQGYQSEAGPAQQYREALAAVDRECKAKYAGKAFADLTSAEQDAVLGDLESGALALKDVDGKAFFAQAIKDIQMGFFADPIYGGNRDMIAWKMIGYPGARYNYLDWVNRHNERFPLPPVSMTGRAEWTPQAR
jgi:gluconate 2-dehydrogenase gamma chain